MKVSIAYLFPNNKIHPIEDETVIVDGKTYYCGQIANGKKHRQGLYIDRLHHVEYKGEWMNDNIHGFGTIRNYFSNFSFTGKFEHNNMIEGKMTWPDGSVYTGFFENNTMNGLGKIVWPNGSKYEGNFKDGNITGSGVYTKSPQLRIL
jgi:hypothetical protein